MSDRELDLCLMRQDRRTVYRSGYIQFANLTYQGEHLAAYAGETVILRYDPRDITTLYIYHLQDSKEVFLTRAHAQGWETETLSYKEAQAISQRRREAGKALDKRSVLEEVRERNITVKKLQQQKKKDQKVEAIASSLISNINPSKLEEGDRELKTPFISPPIEPTIALENEVVKPKKPVPYVRVYDYEELKREGGLLRGL